MTLLVRKFSLPFLRRPGILCESISEKSCLSREISNLCNSIKIRTSERSVPRSRALSSVCSSYPPPIPTPLTPLPQATSISDEELVKYTESAIDKKSQISIESFRWSGFSIPECGIMFPEHNFGSFLLDRDRVVNTVTGLAEAQSDGTKSIYIHGCMGMGKTSVLKLIGDAYLKKGYDVYFFKTAIQIPFDAGSQIRSLLKNPSTKRVAFLVDEIASNLSSPVFVELMKDNFSNLVIIGAAVPTSFGTNFTAYFKEEVGISTLALKKDDSDFLKLVDKMTAIGVTTPEITKAICEYIFDHCGGHLYPTLRLIEIFFADSSLATHVKSLEEFKKYFLSVEFFKNTHRKWIEKRCFANSFGTITAATQLLSGNPKAKACVDTISMNTGWWNESTMKIHSRFIVNYCLRNVPSIKNTSALTLDSRTTPLDNTLSVLKSGFSSMEKEDFSCLISKTYVPVGDALSFNWAKRAMANFTNVFMASQETSSTSRVSYYVDGFCDHTIEFIRDATVTTCDEHLDRFLNEKSSISNFLIVNFAIKSADVVLPTNEKFHDIIFTYVHATNTLYRGANVWLLPATKLRSSRRKTH